MSAPSLVELWLRLLNARPLRSEHLAVPKDDLMMLVLSNSSWFVDYRRLLESRRRQNDDSPWPPYPHERVERMELIVDSLIRASVDPEYTR